jgi:hypothetical protein
VTTSSDRLGGDGAGRFGGLTVGSVAEHSGGLARTNPSRDEPPPIEVERMSTAVLWTVRRCGSGSLVGHRLDMGHHWFVSSRPMGDRWAVPVRRWAGSTRRSSGLPALRSDCWMEEFAVFG